MTLSLDRSSLHAAYRNGLDPRTVISACLAEAAAPRHEGIFIALAEAAADAALATLGPFDPARRPLWGLPFAIKDNIDLAGVPTTAACPDYAYVPQRSATVVERLMAAGAIPLGKTNLDQFATGLVGVRTPYPAPKNAFDPAIVPGGSSSGSAVAVARGIASFALGTDTAGSGRIPAGLNNLVGLKPTLGAVPVRGVVPACQTLDCVSVFGLTVADAWSIFTAMAGYDAEDPWSKRVALGVPGSVPEGLRAGVPDRASRRFFGDARAEEAFAAALALHAAQGVTFVECDLAPFFDVAGLLYDGGWVAERYAAIRPFIEKHRASLHPTTARIILGAERLSAADAFAGLHRLAALRRVTETVWADIDVLVVPTVPRAYAIAELDTDPIGPNSALGTYASFVNLLDLCALAVPGPFRADGLPGGTTLIAPAGRDALLAALGVALQAAAGLTLGATGAPMPVGDAFAKPFGAGADEIEIVVVGAHLSGMPLNPDLTAIDGRLIRSIDTTPDYRLYALPGGPVRRPGLVRVPDGTGMPIATEVWALPSARFGFFMTDIPSPLGIGTVRLADGTTAKGFLCEAAGLAGAKDVSTFGGWRRYVDAAGDGP